jgi:hypothetical protein
MEYLLKKRELDNSYEPNWTRAKGTQPEKNTTSKKELLTLTTGNIAEGSDEVGVDDDEWEPVEPITSPCDSVSGTEG